MKYFSNEFILPHVLTPIQHDVLIGGLLGDFGMTKSEKNKYPRFKVDRQILDLNYIKWQFNIFKDLCLSGVKEFERYDKRYDKTHKYCSFRTRAVPAFLDYYNKWYPNGIRQVPEDIELSPLIIAVWFADDGCIIVNKNNLTLKLSTESFGKLGADILISKLEKRYNQTFPLYRKKKDKDQFFIKTSTLAAQPFLKEIEPHIIEMGMIRKYDRWKNFDLDNAPKLGSPVIIRKDLNDIALSLGDFSTKQLVEDYNIEYHEATYYVNNFLKKKYFERYESNDKFKVYHYKLTDLGREEILKLNKL